MQNKKRLHAREFFLLALPALLFVIWALFTNEQDVRSNISGKWRGASGNIVEFRVQGNELLVWQNGRKDPKASYRLIGDNIIEFVDHRHTPVRPMLIPTRIRRGVLEMSIGVDTERAYRIE